MSSHLAGMDPKSLLITRDVRPLVHPGLVLDIGARYEAILKTTNAGNQVLRAVYVFSILMDDAAGQQRES